MARKQFQNLTEPMYYVLLCLNEPLHGYGIMQKIEELTKGRVKVGPGTLYNLLSRFEKEGIVQKAEMASHKKCYIITSYGEKLLNDEINRLDQLVQDGKQILEEDKNGI